MKLNEIKKKNRGKLPSVWSLQNTLFVLVRYFWNTKTKERPYKIIVVKRSEIKKKTNK